MTKILDKSVFHCRVAGLSQKVRSSVVWGGGGSQSRATARLHQKESADVGQGHDQDASLPRFSRHIPQVRDPGEDLELAGRIIHPFWIGNSLGSPGGVGVCCRGEGYCGFPQGLVATVTQPQISNRRFKDDIVEELFEYHIIIMLSIKLIK